MMLKILVFIFFFDSEAIGKSLWNDVSPDSDEIVGGHDVDIKQYPYQVSLVRMGVHFACGGSILSPDYVLTAAHCIEIWQNPKNYKIRTGSSFYNKSGDLYDILSVVWHPKFKYPPNLDYDVGIIKTEKMAINGVTTKAVQLAEAGSALKPGATVVVTGWGQTSYDGDGSTVLKGASLTVVSTERCKELWSNGLIIVNDRMICAGLEKTGQSTCHGDSGGPMVDESSLIQYGIVSFGPLLCNTTKIPDGFTSVPAVRDWIREQTGI